jgi:protein-S-isoprenylcysteine O-methyltransferase Ste14
MSLENEFARTGSWLFRWRSYLPLAILALLLSQFPHFRYPFESHRADLPWEMFCLAISLAGIGVRVATIGCAAHRTSGRNTQEQIADSLNTSGMYSVVRHPLYLGNFLMWLGIALVPGIWWLALIVVLSFALYYERIMFAEERFLRGKFGAEFEQWAAVTPAFIPRLGAWRPAPRPFCLRTVLRREYSGLFATIACFTALEVLSDFAVHRQWMLDRLWAALFAGGLLSYLVLRTMKRHTQWLSVPDR